MSPNREKIIAPGKNCWRRIPASRTAFLIDGKDYFSAFASAVEQARHQVLIVGWDIDSRIRLRRDDDPHDLPAELGAFLNAVAARRRGLHIHVLDWDFALLFALEREPLPLFSLGWQTHRRLHFAMDDRHPVGASHHQKIVVVDDRVAFAGGLDLTRARWDTPAHAPHDERRVDNGDSYPPFHDVQMLVEGEAAAALGSLARERWQRATGKDLDAPPPVRKSPWPQGVKADLEKVEVAIARTDPVFEGRPEVAEVKQLFLDAIAAARSTIYIENQYLTSAAVGEALAARLREEKGPEVIIVLPLECSGWLEETIMGVLRARLLRRLREADRFDRLRVFYPMIGGPENIRLNVHAKVMVVDDRLLRIGSANLTNRSMGYDTECDLAIEADERPGAEAAIANFRHRLLAEHLGTTPEKVAATLEETGALREAVAALQGSERFLAPLEEEADEWLEEVVPEFSLLDPERPARLEDLVEELVPPEEAKPTGFRSRRGWHLIVLLICALGLAAAWRWTPLSEWFDLETLRLWGEKIRLSSLTPVLVLSAYLLGGLVLFPVTLLILITAMTFGPFAGFPYALAGCLLSALTTYGFGRLLGRDTVRRVAGGKLNRLSRWLARRGLLAVVTVRLLPVAPFTVVNMVAGASHIRFRDFFLGTLLGMSPGIVGIVIFEQSLEQAIQHPEPENLLLLGFILVILASLAWGLQRWLTRREGRAEGENPGGEESR